MTYVVPETLDIVVNKAERGVFSHRAVIIVGGKIISISSKINS